MLQSVTLKFTERAPITIPAQGITIFVGPNNSGKSLVLREIERAISDINAISSGILESFDLSWPSAEDLETEIAKWKAKEPKGLSPETVRLIRYRPDGQLEDGMASIGSLRSYLAHKNKAHFSSQFFRYYQMRLDGRTRFDLTNDRSMGDLTSIAQNTLAQLFKDDELREEIRTIVYDAFGLYFVIDPTLGGTLRIRLSKTSPPKDEQSLNQEARNFHSQALHIKDASDGVQAFVGILIASRSSDYRLLLVDEPEAFLHPPLARKLGYELARDITKRSSSLFASTHSADFLIGCLQASANVRVVRLEYSDEKSRATVVDTTALNEFFRTPLIRNANVISALFHDGVVVTESDNDRVFYSEIYHRISEIERGCPSLLFVNAQNKQTIRDIVGPLRKFGVPAAAICDIDILKDGGQTWTGWLTAAGIPSPLHGGLGVMRGDINRAYIKADINMKIDGVYALPDGERAAANNLFDTLAQHGVFVTRKGELENWLADLSVPGKKTDWTIAMLEKMGSDPTSSTYIHPKADDVWKFMRDIIAWIKNPARQGIPLT